MRYSINIICSYEFPGRTAAVSRIEAIARVLAKRYSVRIITVTNDPSKDTTVGKYHGCEVHYLYHRVYNKTSFFIRSLHELKISFQLSRYVHGKEGAVLVSVPFMFLIPAAIIVSKRRPVVLDVRDLVWEYLPDKPFPMRWIQHALRTVMVFFMRKYDVIAASNEYEVRWLRAYLPNKKISLISNGIQQERFYELRDIASFSTEKTDYTYIVYAGNIGLAQRLDVLVEVGANLPDVHVSIAGEGNDYPRIKNLIEERGSDNITLLGSISRDEVLELYKTADILFAQLEATFSSAVPSKLYEYLSTGLPIVYGGVGEAARFLENFENVFLFEPGNSADLKRAIEEARVHRYRSTDNIKAIERSFLREAQADKYNTVFENLLTE
jgi:glycosyltransferase involved in cell wall biosynthesis